MTLRSGELTNDTEASATVWGVPGDSTLPPFTQHPNVKHSWRTTGADDQEDFVTPDEPVDSF